MEVFKDFLNKEDLPYLWQVTHNNAIRTIEKFSGRTFGYWAYTLWKKRKVPNEKNQDGYSITDRRK